MNFNRKERKGKTRGERKELMVLECESATDFFRDPNASRFFDSTEANDEGVLLLVRSHYYKTYILMFCASALKNGGDLLYHSNLIMKPSQHQSKECSQSAHQHNLSRAQRGISTLVTLAHSSLHPIF